MPGPDKIARVKDACTERLTETFYHQDTRLSNKMPEKCRKNQVI